MSASIATSAGWRARASASVMPALKPSRAAAASTLTSRRALFCVATTASAAAGSTSCARRARSVGRRGSHRDRNRRFVKPLLLASPDQTEGLFGRGFGAGVEPRLDQLRGEGRQAGQRPARRRRLAGARACRDLEARLGGGGKR